MRLTKEREAEVRAVYRRGDFYDREVIADLLAELDAVRAERDAARADERAKVVAWLRSRDGARHVLPGTLPDLADAIERGEHEVKP